jgi:ribose transport system substrate-binding protein
MSQEKAKDLRWSRAARAGLAGLAAATAAFAVAACGASKGQDDSGGGKKLITLELSFPCGLNEYATHLCAGARAEAKRLGDEFRFQIKTGVNYSDNDAFNNLIQNSLQLDPSGLIIFPAGPAAQTPVINRACAKGVKIIIIDSPATGLKCQSSFIAADHEKLGADVGKWLVAHPPASKEVGIVTQPPGEYASTDARVRGFEQAVESAGYKVVATVTTDLSLDRTRAAVTNMVTAHPKLGAIFSANGPMGQGTAQALRNNSKVVQLTLDGFVQDVKMILNGNVSANAAQNPYQMGELAVRYMAQALRGEKVPARTYTTSKVVDKTNAKEYIAAGGLH